MKRVVECPSCETKLQVFDTGKGAKQKCPRCKNEFDINPEKANEATETAKASAPEPQQAAAVIKQADKPAASKTQAKDEAPTDAVKDGQISAAKSAEEQPASESKKADEPKVEEPKVEEPKAAEPKTAEPKAEDKKEAVQKEAVAADKPTGIVKKPAAAAAAKPSPAVAAPPAMPIHEPPIAGLSGLQFMVIVALLIVTIVLQVLNMKKNSALAANQKMIYDKVKVK